MRGRGEAALVHVLVVVVVVVVVILVVVLVVLVVIVVVVVVVLVLVGVVVVLDGRDTRVLARFLVRGRAGELAQPLLRRLLLPTPLLRDDVEHAADQTVVSGRVLQQLPLHVVVRVA